MTKASWILGFATALTLLTSVSPSAAPCGDEVACELADGQYYVLPLKDEARRAGAPAIIYLHGHKGKALNAVRNPAFRKLAEDLGVVFVAVQGVDGTWSFPSAPRVRRDEFAFFDKVLDDLVLRHGVDRNRILLTGFSSGAFMTWYLACDKPDRFGGYAPVAGAFWKPLPEACASPLPYLFHVHGTTDTVVPLAGRALGGGRWHQGDVFKSFDVWRSQLAAGTVERKWAEPGTVPLQCESWEPQAGILELCLHDGGHVLRTEWIARAWRKLAALREWDLPSAAGED